MRPFYTRRTDADGRETHFLMHLFYKYIFIYKYLFAVVLFLNYCVCLRGGSISRIFSCCYFPGSYPEHCLFVCLTC